jgi:hypothetical protein
MNKTTTTIVYKLFTYPATESPGLPLVFNMNEFGSMSEAQSVGKSSIDTCTFYEIQAVTTIVEPPSKKNPLGEITIIKNIVERVSLRENIWVAGERERVKQELLKKYGAPSSWPIVV